jgi:hypothetical protein
MRITIVFFIIFCLGNITLGQSPKDITDPEHLGSRSIKLKAQRTVPAGIKLPFSSIQVLDSRFDTSKIGFLPIRYEFIHNKKDAFKKINFQGGTAPALQQYYNEYYTGAFDSSGLQLVIVLKRFWLSGVKGKDLKRIDLVTNNEINKYLHVKWEYYIGKNDQYLPVKRVDTLFFVDDDLARYISGEFDERKLAEFKFLLKSMIELYDFDKGVKEFNGQHKKTLAEINGFNNKRYDCNILSDTVFKKGVYRNFEEFRNNKPFITEFEERSRYKGLSQRTRYLLGSDGALVDDYWGYYDGKKLRIGKFGNDLLYRCGNAFQFYLELNLSNDNNPFTNNTYWVPYQLDMESGQVY